MEPFRHRETRIQKREGNYNLQTEEKTHGCRKIAQKDKKHA